MRGAVSEEKSEIYIFFHSDQDNQLEWGLDWKGPAFLSHGSSVSAALATLVPTGLPWQGMSPVSIVAGRLHRVDASLHGMAFFKYLRPMPRCVFFKALSDALKSCRPDAFLAFLAFNILHLHLFVSRLNPDVMPTCPFEFLVFNQR